MTRGGAQSLAKGQTPLFWDVDTIANPNNRLLSLACRAFLSVSDSFIILL